MFLIVFVTLIISIIGLYAQVVTLQAAKINAAQSALTQTMMTWHGAATNYVQNLYSTGDIPTAVTTGCIITPTTTAALPQGITYCTDGVKQLALPAPGSPYGLPVGFLNTNFSFFTFVYQAPGTNTPYVVTYVDPTMKDSTGYLILPTPKPVTIGFTIYDLMRQFANITTNYLAYGTVFNGGVLVLEGASNGVVSAGATFHIPPSIPAGSVAIISAAN